MEEIVYDMFKVYSAMKWFLYKVSFHRLILYLFSLLIIGFLLQYHTASAVISNRKQLRTLVHRLHKTVCDTQKTGFARCHARVSTNDLGQPLGSSSPLSTSYGPLQFHTSYNLPCTPLGSLQAICQTPSSFGPQTIAIVDAFNAPTIENDLHVYSSYYGIPDCSKANGCLTVVNQSGGTSLPTKIDSGWAFETSLDVEIAHALCQTCKILLVEANSNSFLDLATGVNTAANLGSSAVSNSYGGSEWSGEINYDSYFNHPGVAVTVSAGDSGYGAEFPAASQYVVSVGGTTLQLYTDNTYANETVWNGTGSGCSAYELANPWQINLPNWTQTSCGNKRGVSDIAADADPSTGAAVYDSTPFSGSSGWWQVGGTSLSSPIIASAYVLAGGVPANTQPAAMIYTNFLPANSHDITSGTNGSCTSIMCQAGIAYDGPTGLGSPNGIGGFNGIAIPTATPTATPIPTSTVVPTSTPTPTPTPTGVDTKKPTVSITSPINGSRVPRRTNISVTASATDNVGVTQVRFYRNNSLNCIVTTAPYTCLMYTANSSGVNITYKAVAFDAANNSASSSITVKTQ